MKRYLVIPILLLYMLAVSGVLIHLHYCGKQLASWNVYVKTTGCGGECGDESKPDHTCCKDEVVSAKVSEDHSSIVSFKYKPAFSETFLLPAGLCYDSVTLTMVAPGSLAWPGIANAPPGNWQEIPLYRLHSRLTYYG